jgi:hypothetical protein
MMMSTHDTTVLKAFAVKPGPYRVLLVRDTLYVACALPCVHPTEFTLRPGQSVTVAP